MPDERTYPAGVPCWVDTDQPDVDAARHFYASLFGWELDDVGFGTMIRRPGYGDHLAATVDFGIRERQDGISAPPGFAEAIGWLVRSTRVRTNGMSRSPSPTASRRSSPPPKSLVPQ
jgi:hypothetical protein